MTRFEPSDGIGMQDTRQAQATRSGLGVPFDVQALEDFCDILEEGLRPGMLPAVLLDCDRRGLGFVDLGAALVEALRLSASGSEAARFDILQDLAEICETWHFDDGRVDPVLIAALGDLSGVDDSDSYQWLESIGSMEREGYVLTWLASRLSGRLGTPWQDTVKSANGLLHDRRAGNLPACVLRASA